MKLALDLAQPFDEAVQDMARALLAAARRDVAGGRGPRASSADQDHAVHEVRKRLKQLRALARLVRPAMGELRYKAESTGYRDLGRRVSAVRDAAALTESVAVHRADLSAALPSSVVDGLEAALARRLARVHATTDIDALLAEVDAGLVASEAGVDDWTLAQEGVAALGVEKTWLRGRSAMAAAADGGGGEEFHQWRKRVKAHRTHCRLLAGLGAPLARRVVALTELSDLLGEEHDLTVLLGVLASEPLLSDGDTAAVRGWLVGRRSGLRASALACGAPLYAERARDLRRWLAKLWEQRPN
jgi:CHAD domain-containing protein